MNYLLKSKPKHPNRIKFVIILLVFLTLSFFGFIFSNFFRGVGVTLSTPVWLVSNSIKNSFGKVGQFFIFKSNLIEENKELTQEVEQLRLKVFDYDVLLKENENLKNSLGRAINSEYIFAKVLSKPPTSPYDTLILDVGSKDGVILGGKVYLSDNVIIGLIKNVTPRTSLVELFSSGSQKIEVVVLRTGVTFNVAGTGGGNLQLEVPKDTDILWGDTFVYPGLKTSIIGSVYYIDSSSQGSFKTVYARLVSNIFEIKSVFIEKDN